MRALITGTGRVAKALQSFGVQYNLFRAAELLPHNAPVPDRQYDAIFGALPGPLGAQSVEIALEKKIPLFDIADLDREAYTPYREEIKRKGIVVISGCGFSPGLLDFILGFEAAHIEHIESIAVEAGTLSTKPHFFPFLWCLEDMIQEFILPSVQQIDGKRVQFPPFGDRKYVSFDSIEAESYYCQSGFEEFGKSSGLKTCTFRNIRPRGFKEFFQFLQGHNLFSEEHFHQIKPLLEYPQGDNLSLATIYLTTPLTTKKWEVHVACKADAPLNSMQQITALFPLALFKIFCTNPCLSPGLFACHQVGSNSALFHPTINQLKEWGISISS